MRGGQITLFFIVGVVLLFTVAIFYIFTLRSHEDANVKSTIDASSNPLLQQYISTCVNTVVEDELFDAGNHSVPQDRTNHYPALSAMSKNSQGILYGVVRKDSMANSQRDIAPLSYPVPQYPNWSVSITSTSFNAADGLLYDFQDGYFGDVHLLAPCNRTGTNNPSSQYRCRYYPDLPPGTAGPAVQAVLIENIQKRVQTCADPHTFNQALNVKAVSSPNVTLTLAPEAVIVHLDYVVTQDDGDHRLQFDQRYNVRYLSIAEFAYDLARKETRDVQFNITNDYRTLPSYKEGFSVTKDVFADGSVINVTDTKSTIRNRPYTLRFAIRHRDPMVNPLIDKSALPCSSASEPVGMPIAAHPDELPMRCTFDGTTLTVTDSYGGHDCLQFDSAGAPIPSGYSC